MDFVGDNNEVNPDNESDLIRFWDIGYMSSACRIYNQDICLNSIDNHYIMLEK